MMDYQQIWIYYWLNRAHCALIPVQLTYQVVLVTKCFWWVLEWWICSWRVVRRMALLRYVSIHFSDCYIPYNASIRLSMKVKVWFHVLWFRERVSVLQHDTCIGLSFQCCSRRQSSTRKRSVLLSIKSFKQKVAYKVHLNNSSFYIPLTAFNRVSLRTIVSEFWSNWCYIAITVVIGNCLPWTLL